MKLKDGSIVKIAVEFTDGSGQLIEFDQKQPLATIIQGLCDLGKLSHPDQYALQFSENNHQNYITEKNRHEIKNGNVLILAFSPAKTATDILSTLNGGTNDEKLAALEKLSKLSTDTTFAMEFINKHGHSLIINSIEQRKYQDAHLAFCLQSFVELMEHGIVSWDILDTLFIATVAGYVSHPKSQDVRILQPALAILESIVLNSTAKYAQVEKEVTISNLVARLENSNPVVQQNTITLINALFLKADLAKKKTISATIWSKQVRGILLSKIIETASDQMGAEMAHQLYVLQTLYLGLLEQRMNLKMDPQDQDSLEKIKELRKIAFEIEANGNADTTNRKQQISVLSKDFKKLGFKNDPPTLDFSETPPGMLALDCMYYFGKNHTEAFTKVVLENSCRAEGHECPFGRTSVELVKLLCQILRIGVPPDEENSTYYPMFFTHDHPFEEFYCICIILLNKTWKEMRATTEDFTKVFSVVRDQIVRALTSQPLNFDKLKEKLQTLTYSKITTLWQQERTSREEWESHAKPIVQLKEIITPDIVDLIQKQRLGYLVEGTRFTKYSNRGQREKNKFWYVRLSINHKILHYDDCDEKSTPSVEDLTNKLPIAEIKALVTGKDCPHMKDTRSQKKTHHLAFSITLDSIDSNKSLDFVAPDEQVFDYWTDGINALLGNKMSSKEAENDLQTLLSMEIKLRLLDAEGIKIPQDPPEIPPDPPNYDFALEFK